MKGILVSVAVAFFLTITFVSSAKLEINPEIVEVNLVGGDSVQVNMTISWLSDYPVICELTTHVEPDNDGIDITYSKNNFTMIFGSENKVVMYVNTSLLLAPDIYNITTHVNTKEQSEEPTSLKDDSSYTQWENFIQPIEQSEQEDELLEDEEEDKFNNTFYYKTKVVDASPHQFWILGGVLLVIIFLCMIIKRKRMVKKPGKREK